MWTIGLGIMNVYRVATRGRDRRTEVVFLYRIGGPRKGCLSNA